MLSLYLVSFVCYHVSVVSLGALNASDINSQYLYGQKYHGNNVSIKHTRWKNCKAPLEVLPTMKMPFAWRLNEYIKSGYFKDMNKCETTHTYRLLLKQNTVLIYEDSDYVSIVPIW